MTVPSLEIEKFSFPAPDKEKVIASPCALVADTVAMVVPVAVSSAKELAAREAEFEPFTRLGLVGQQLAQIQPGAFPTTTIGYQQSAAPASPMASFLGGAAGAGGVLGKLGIFG